MPKFTPSAATINYLWQQFQAKLEYAIQETQRRTDAGYDLAERMPTQAELNELVKDTDKLPSVLSERAKATLYTAFVKMSTIAQVAFYNELARERSNDNVLDMLNIEDRNEKTQKYTETVKKPFIASGGRETKGRSAIDNTIPPNVLLKTDATRYIARYGWLKILKAMHNKFPNAGFNTVQSRTKIWNLIKDKIPEVTVDPKEKAFIDFIHAQPGAFFGNDRKQHLNALAEGSANGNFRALPGHIRDNIAPRRYLKFEFKRNVPLSTVRDGNIVTLRAAGTKECVYLRMNEGHYLPKHHAMSLMSGQYGKFGKYEVPVDPTAFTHTNAQPDLEWLCFEASLYNYFRLRSNALPVAPSIMVGRNSKIGSSIMQTAHNQLAEACIQDFAHFNQINEPKPLLELDAIFDLVQVGTKNDAFFCRLNVKDVYTKKLLEFVNGLIIDMQLAFKNNIDFQIQIIPDKHYKQFSLIFIPFAALQQRVVDGKPTGEFINPRGESNLQLQVAEHLHVGNSSGIWGSTAEQRAVWKQDGKGALQRLYDFTSLEGTRAYIEDYLQRFLAADKANTSRPSRPAAMLN